MTPSHTRWSLCHFSATPLFSFPRKAATNTGGIRLRSRQVRTMAGSTESLPRALTGCAIPAGHALRPQTDRDPLISPASRSNVRRIGVGGSVHQQQWGVPLDAAVVRANNRRIDVALLPLLSLLYLFNGLDRGNIGNAQTQGAPPALRPPCLLAFGDGCTEQKGRRQAMYLYCTRQMCRDGANALCW